MSHTFHIPVLGLGYSVDTPIKAARYGISSVASIVDDELIERMRKHHMLQNEEEYFAISIAEADYRAKRITAYLNLMDRIVSRQFDALRLEPFEPGTDLSRYFELLPETTSLKIQYLKMLATEDSDLKQGLQHELRNSITKGSIDVNIMSKVDKMNRDTDGELLDETYSDASAALRGFALSTLDSSLILSAGMNPRLYNYLEQFEDFYPDKNGKFKKKITLKVSDFRSAFIQAKYLAKKGIWVSEFRIESGLNCGGHAFATEGYLLGPILEEFKTKKQAMFEELFALYHAALEIKGRKTDHVPAIRITVQGGIGTAEEDAFLLDHYAVDATGWGSPFLLVPELTNVDKATLKSLITAEKDDFYVSNSSPLGVLFNNFKKSSAEKQRLERIAKGRPGSPCKKRYLVSDTEFTAEPICTASRQYQYLKIRQLQTVTPQPADYRQQLAAITDKLCLCEGLSNAVLLENHSLNAAENKAVAICPGPNISWFSKIYSVEEMVGHIYGRINLLANVNRPNMFINELNLYLDHLKKDMELHAETLTDKKHKYFQKFREQLISGIAYYKSLVGDFTDHAEAYKQKMVAELDAASAKLEAFYPAGAV